MISLRGPRLKIFAGILALICLVAGVYFTFFQSKGFAETTATIVDFEEDYSGEDTVYWPIVEYTVNGQTYTEKLDLASGTDRIGKEVTIMYDPENPEVIHGNGAVGIYFIVVSVVILVIIVISTIKGRQDKKQTEELQELGGFRGYALHEEGEERELYFLTDLGTPKYGHRLEDSSKRVLYEAKMTNFSLVSAHKFDFIDHEHGKSTPHLVGHEEESQWDSILIDNHYTFDFDGVDVWKHLKQNGIKVESGFTAGEATIVGTKYRIFRDGVEIGRAEQTSQYPHEEDAAQHKVGKAIPIQGFFRVWTKEQNLDLLFITLMAFARSGASDDKGGNFGAIIGTFKNK